MTRKFHKKGFTLIDILLGITVFLIMSTAIFSWMIFSLRISSQIIHNYEAVNFAREGIEALENIRNQMILKSDRLSSDTKFAALKTPNTTLCFVLNSNNISYTSADRFGPWNLLQKDCASTNELTIFEEKGKDTIVSQLGKNPEYRRVVRITNKPASAYFSTTAVSEYTPQTDDILEITTDVYWKENSSYSAASGANIQKKSLTKILTNWPART